MFPDRHIVDNAAFRNYARNTFAAEVIDMESAAVAHVAYVNGTPFIAFRSLSDLARLRTLYPARGGLILSGSEVSYVRSVSVVSRPDAADRDILSALAGLPRVDDRRVVKR